MPIQQVDIAPGFSVYQLVERVQGEKVSAVMYNRGTMNLISYEIENVTRIDRAPNRVFSGFQRFSRFMPQVERYRDLAANAESVYVFGIQDITPPEIPNVVYIPLEEGSQLAKEWFLISYSDKFASVLATEELSEIDDPDATRQFRGVWSFDVRMAAILEEWMSNTVDAPDFLVRERDHNRIAQGRLINQITDRMMGRIQQRGDFSHMTETQEQLRIIVRNTLKPLTVD
jgi:DICT domain-containing protein